MPRKSFPRRSSELYAEEHYLEDRKTMNIKEDNTILKRHELTPKGHRRQSLTPFEKIKLETDRTTAHGHPLILPSEYGEYGPVFDVIALFHNAIKRQILVAYNMLEAMLRSKYEVNHSHLNLFFDWFDTFEDVVFAFFDVEEEHVYPFLEEANVNLPQELSELAREKCYRKIFSSLDRIGKEREKCYLLPVGEAIPTINRLLDVFLHLIVEYYNTQNEFLPKLIFEADIDGKMEVELRRIFVNALRAKHNYATYLPFVANWLTESQLKTWKSKYLGPVIGIRYDQWSRKFQATHNSIPIRLFKSLSSTRERDQEESPSLTSFVPGGALNIDSLDSYERVES